MPLFPTYRKARALMRVLEGEKRADTIHLINSIKNQTGTPKNPVNWTEPDKWIPERLKGRDRELASEIWSATKNLVNPRHIYGAYLFINGYELLLQNGEGVYQLTETGHKFLKGETEAIRMIDESEGLLQLLNILSTKQKAMRGDLLPEWSEYLLEVSNFKSSSTFNDTLRRRVSNLIDRKLVDRKGNTYSISPEGIAYLESSNFVSSSPRRDTLKAVEAFNVSQRTELQDRLAKMDPYAFEHLIKELLEAMGYDDVTVTKAAGDKGVDVVGTIQFGITTVREVVQVKRTPNSALGRPLVDQLRGALHYHQAIQGTIITLGRVAKGAQDAAVFQGAAPITLIDGEKLLDLLIEHEVAVKKRSIVMWEVDSEFFSKDAEEILD